MSTQELQIKIKTLKEYQRMIEELQEEMDTVKDEIKAVLTTRGVDEIVAGEYKVRYTVVESSRFDTTAFRKAMPDLAAQFTKTTASKRFSIA